MHHGPTYSAVTAFAASEARVAVRAEAHHSSGVSAVAAGPTYSAVTAFAASEARVAVRAEAHHSSGVSAVAK
ncbi:hypothetical protein [Mycobacterium tuberculosis]|uniref:hypothetical protein n=1 Tax=Mycobacterium tuberculosis TaxID=1773 RepID=UPI002729BF19|nr:hypothetical protein [Mycobacterium tuberculosis]